MAPKSAAIFEFKVLAPVEKKIAGFFEELKQKRPVSPDAVRDIEKILINFDADQLLPPDEFEALAQRAQKLQNQLVVIDYLSTHQDSEIYFDLLEVYLAFVKEKPIEFLPPYCPPQKISSNTSLSNTALENIGARINQLDQELKPLEAQPPLSMIMPTFETPEELYTYISPFQQRVERVDWLNVVKEELMALERQLSPLDKPYQAISGLLARIHALHADFSRFPLSLKKVISGPTKASEELPLVHAPTTEFFSQKQTNLTLS
ncbi:MAG TPA: hypothetical protein VGV92_04905 [Gammaproteobacteria bacterium]|nr:hypothetical protein [Gammaproteobacteria bacterium]